MKSFWQLLFPPICQGCGALGSWLCSHCLAELEFYPNPVTISPNLTALTSVQAVAYLQPPISNLVKALKYRRYSAIGTWLGNWLSEVIQPPKVSFITWVPLHKTKQNWRGFSQAELIGRALANQLKLPCGELCLKLVNTSAQAQITNQTDRLIHLQNKFQLLPVLTQPANLAWLKHQKILIIDDVVTTSATLNAVATPLKLAGTTLIYGLVVAHGQ